MPAGRAHSLSVRRLDRLGSGSVDDHVVVEEPLEIRLDGVVVATTMRTPGDDSELAAGFCFTDGLLAGAPIRAITHPIDDEARTATTIDVDTAGTAPTVRPRLNTVTSSCGWCGTDHIDDLFLRHTPIEAARPFSNETLLTVAEAVRPHQELFAVTGGSHAAAVFDHDGRIRLVREDIGRHNAVDKIVGAMLLADELPADDLGLFVSGRTSFEIVQKAWAARFTTIVAVSAASALAVEAATRARITLAGFTRPDRMNLYTEPVTITADR